MPLSAFKHFLLPLVTLLVLLLGACGDTATPTTGAGASTATPMSDLTKPTTAPLGATSFKLGFVFTTSGDNAAYGISQKKASQLAVDELNGQGGVNGAKIEPLFEDDAGTPDGASTAFQKLINGDQVVAIIGPTLSNSAKTSDPLAQKSGVPVLAVSNTAGGIVDLGDYIWRDSLSEAQVIPQTIKMLKQKNNPKSVAIIYGNDDAFTKAGYDVFKKSLTDNGISVSDEETFTKGQTDFHPQMLKIKGSNPEAIICSALTAEAVQIVKQGREIGIDTKVPFVGGNGFNSPNLMAKAGKDAEGVIVGAAWNSASPAPRSKDFVTNFTAKYNSPPDQFAAQAYTGVYIIADALRRAGKVDRTAVRDALATTNLDTPLGMFKFLPTRDADHTPVVQIVKDGKFTVYQ